MGYCSCKTDCKSCVLCSFELQNQKRNSSCHVSVQSCLVLYLVGETLSLNDLCVLFNSPFIRSPCCRATQRSINRWPMKRWWWRTRSYLDLKGHLGLQVSFVDILLIFLFNFSILFPTPLFLCFSRGAQGPKVPLVPQDKWGHQACPVLEATWGPWDPHRTCRISNRDAAAQWYVSVFISNLNTYQL